MGGNFVIVTVIVNTHVLNRGGRGILSPLDVRI